MSIDASDLLDRFLRYVKIDTRSDDHSESSPSTACQWDLLRLLRDELQALGASDVELTTDGYVLATVPATPGCEATPTIAWFAHVDTATNLPGGAKPIVHKAYDGRVLRLPDDPAQVLDPAVMPELRNAVGKDLITASGTTLLGADDKAGVAIVMAAVRHLLAHPELPHGRLRVCFNPDEEISRGVKSLDLAKLGADFAYTLDGDKPGELNYETFSGDGATVSIEGVATHPGYAKGIMVNALRLAGKLLASLPADRAPESTDGKQGYIHPVEVSGSNEKAEVRFILRDFEREGLARQGETLRELAARIAAEEPRAKVTVEIREQYRNMRYWLEKDMRPVDCAAEAYKRAGITPHFTAIRGGTDGSNLTARGLLCPNLFTGMQEIHSQREWVTLQDMHQAAGMLLHLAAIWAGK